MCPGIFIYFRNDEFSYVVKWTQKPWQRPFKLFRRNNYLYNYTDWTYIDPLIQVVLL